MDTLEDLLILRDPPIIEDPLQKNNAKDRLEDPPIIADFLVFSKTIYLLF